MAWQSTPLVFPLLVSALVCAALGGFAWMHRRVPAARGFVLLMAACAWWALAYAVYRSSADFELKRGLALATQAGAIFVAMAWAVFALQYTGRTRWLRPGPLAGLGAVQALTLAMALTNDRHHAFWTRFDPVVRDGLLAIDSVPAWGFWLHVVYSWGLMSLAVVLVAHRALGARQVFRRQGAAIVAAAAVPWLGNVLHVTGLVSFEANPMPFLFTLTGVVFFWAIFRLRLLDLVPVAREALVEELPDGVLVVDEAGRVLDLNPAARALLGVRGEDHGAALAPLRRLLAGPIPAEPVRVETGAAEGARRLEVRVTPVRDRGGGAGGRLLVLRDLTEGERRDRSLALQRAYLEQLFEAAPQGLALLDDHDRIVDVNPAWERLFGYAPEEARGRAINDLIVPPHLAAEAERSTSRVMAGGEAHLETVRRRADGSLVEVHVTGTPVFVESRQVGIWGIYQDISERTAQERARADLLRREQSLRAEAEAAVSARDSVLGVVSHDLRNPLTAIILQADTALVEAPAEMREGMEEIVRSAERMERLIRDLLDVAAIEAGQLRVDPAATAAETLLEAAAAMLAPLAEERGVALTVEREALAGAEVLADRDRVLQVLSNLVGNALKYTPKGGRVVVEAEPAGAEVRFRVRDSGPGIAEGDLPRVWERFWQAGGPLRRQGAGLGLPIARGIVEAHTGRVWVESPPGAGATFGFTLPAAGAVLEPPRLPTPHVAAG